MRSLILFGLVASSLFLAGCGQHYVITSKFVMTQKTETPPEIVETATYRDAASKIKTVALKAPSRCSNQTSDQRTGAASSQELMLGTNCATEMAEIERAFTKASYKVISWTVLEREIESFERNAKYQDSKERQNLSPLKIAENLGAQILFQINSLEASNRSYTNVGKDESWEFYYYEADKYGRKTGEMAFDDGDRAYLKRKFFDKDEMLKRVRIPFVTLNANAIQVKDGESIWFYRWSHSDLSYEYPQYQLIFCKPPMVCSIDTPEENNSEKSTSNANRGKISRENEFFSGTNEQPEDMRKAAEFKLLKDVTENLVSSFSKR